MPESPFLSCPIEVLSQTKRLRLNAFGLTTGDLYNELLLGYSNKNSLGDDVVDTPMVHDANGNSLFSPPSSSGPPPPPAPFDEEFAGVPLMRPKSCSELFDEVATLSSSYVSPTPPDNESHELECTASEGLWLEHDTVASDQYSSGGRVEMKGKKLRRHMTEPYKHNPQTPFRDSMKSLSQDDVIFTPQPVFTRYQSSGAGAYDWGVSVTAGEVHLQSFYVMSSNREIKPSNQETMVSNADKLKSNAKVRKKKALMRRMSHSRSGLFSPGSSVCKKIRLPVKLSPGKDCTTEEVEDEWNLVDKICDGVGFGVPGEHIGDHAMDSISHGVNELTFNGVIVGGVYENCFDSGIPVVSAPSSYDNRVVNVSMDCYGSLCLHLFLPNSKTIKIVNLGKNWYCYKTSTGAFLVTKNEIAPHRRMVCYFLPKHPLRWAHTSSPKYMHDYSIGSIVACDEHDHPDYDFQGNRSVCFPSTDGDDGCNMSPGEVAASEPLCRVLITSMDTSVDSMRGDLPYQIGDVHMSETTVENSFENCLILHSDHRVIESDCSFDDSEVLEASSVDWNNPIVASYVCEFLDPGECAINASVSTAWALAFFKSRARQLSIGGNCDCLDKHHWVQFMAKYSDGAYLSQGACKMVYRVRAGAPNVDMADEDCRWDAVSVMDIQDLVDRGVEESISRELEISMVTSSLVSLNISPNFIQVYSVFTSQYPPSATFWKPATSRQGVSGCASMTQISSRSVISTLQREASRMTPGNYQYIRMELCSGGDLEEVVRRQAVVDPECIRNFFFQMCFSLYACRERLSMRHYDIKLLNFFCSDSHSLSGRSEERCMSSDLSYIRVGFGDHTYLLPLGASCDNTTDIIKLADFGTSVIGSKTLGCPIDIHQVNQMIHDCYVFDPYMSFCCSSPLWKTLLLSI
jgi:hypothetical protein